MRRTKHNGIADARHIAKEPNTDEDGGLARKTGSTRPMAWADEVVAVIQDRTGRMVRVGLLWMNACDPATTECAPF